MQKLVHVNSALQCTFKNVNFAVYMYYIFEYKFNNIVTGTESSVAMRE